MVFGERVITDRDPRRHQVRPHMTAQIAVGDDALPACRRRRVDDAGAAEAAPRHDQNRLGHFGVACDQRQLFRRRA